MTNNQLTDERLVKILSETQATIMEHNSRCVRGSVEVDARLFESMIMELQERRKAAMDSEPVAYMYDGEDGREYNGHNEFSGGGKGIPLYLHAQQPVVQPIMFIDGDISSDDAAKLANVIREFNEEDERPLAKMARMIRENPHPTNECDMPKAQPAPVVQDEIESTSGSDYDYYYCDGWNACRAAMLQGKE